jgi:hypothetical protein
MTDFPGARRFLDILWYPKRGEQTTFYFIPGAPLPERDPQGRPTLQLWVIGKGARLQFGVRLSVEAEELEGLRQEIAAVMGLSNPAVIQLAPAPFSVKVVELISADGKGQSEVLDSRPSSGYPPFNTLFNISLDEPQAAQAAEAVKGSRDILRVQYTLALPVEVSTQTTVEGDVRADVAALGQGSQSDQPAERTGEKRRQSRVESGGSTYHVDEYHFESSSSTTIISRKTSAKATEEAHRETVSFEECRAGIERALQEGRLSLTRTSDPGVPAALVEEADDEAQEKSAQMLLDMVTGSAQPQREHASLTATAARTATITVPLTRSADISSWFAAGAANHIRKAL